MNTLEEITNKVKPTVVFNEIEEEIEIGGNPIIIFDETVARNAILYSMGRDIKNLLDTTGQKINQKVIIDIAKTLVDKVGVPSPYYPELLKIGNKAIVFSADYDYTGDDLTANVRSKPKIVYIIVPGGAKSDGRVNEHDEVYAIPKIETDPKKKFGERIPEVYSELIASYGLSPTETAKLYNHLFGTKFDETLKQTNWRKNALYAALVAGAAALIGLYSCHVNNNAGNPTKSSIKNPYQKYIEPSKNTPLTQKI
ncbi:hypothetical protein HYW20_00300 [Candidatus Woesearchaeota archaeon]|nr:hypothetical protein [Candidatus Woesearchaeota archaeon]